MSALSPGAQDAVERTLRALERGKLKSADLTTRGIGQALSKTTGALYHHFGSLDGFLHQVAQAGLARLGQQLLGILERGGSMADLAEAFVRFGLEHRELYRLMFEREYDWRALRRAGVLDADMPGLGMWQGLIQALQARGSKTAEMDARLLYAGLHGLVSLASTGRTNVARLEISDQQMACDLARQLADRLVGKSTKAKS